MVKIAIYQASQSGFGVMKQNFSKESSGRLSNFSSVNSVISFTHF